ncbi:MULTISPECIES: thiamine pyrophosphate-dependent enzyme [unclassified Leisingera]|uniref:thiamine pyrophosphate-dependent enzyme n=1 Tax=unclassified Leisingera TaxID=2614906 RepID=UPI001FFDC9B0|nr:MULTISPECIES: thiamine pyrophosphate-dependent enzyme [unclassified Leisingera]
MHPRRALAEIRAALPENAIVTLDTGNTCLQAADRLAHYQPMSLITPLEFGLVGFGLAAAIGAKAASPERPVVAVMGDGAAGYTMIEIQTAIQYKLPIVVVVLDNEAWGAEKAYQQEFLAGVSWGLRSPRPAMTNSRDLAAARVSGLMAPVKWTRRWRQPLPAMRPPSSRAKSTPAR